MLNEGCVVSKTEPVMYVPVIVLVWIFVGLSYLSWYVDEEGVICCAVSKSFVGVVFVVVCGCAVRVECDCGIVIRSRTGSVSGCCVLVVSRNVRVCCCCGIGLFCC